MATLLRGGGLSSNPLNASNWDVCTLNSWFGYRNIAYDYINHKYYYADGYRGYYEINNGSIGSMIYSGRLSTSGNNYELRTMFCKLGYLVSVYNYNSYGYARIYNLNTGVIKTFNQFAYGTNLAVDGLNYNSFVVGKYLISFGSSYIYKFDLESIFTSGTFTGTKIADNDTGTYYYSGCSNINNGDDILAVAGYDERFDSGNSKIHMLILNINNWSINHDSIELSEDYSNDEYPYCAEFVEGLIVSYVKNKFVASFATFDHSIYSVDGDYCYNYEIIYDINSNKFTSENTQTGEYSNSSTWYYGYIELNGKLYELMIPTAYTNFEASTDSTGLMYEENQECIRIAEVSDIGAKYTANNGNVDIGIQPPSFMRDFNALVEFSINGEMFIGSLAADRYDMIHYAACLPTINEDGLHGFIKIKD